MKLSVDVVYGVEIRLLEVKVGLIYKKQDLIKLGLKPFLLLGDGVLYIGATLLNLLAAHEVAK